MVHPFFVNMLDKFEALMRKVSWHFLALSCHAAFHGEEKTNGGHIFKSHNNLAIIIYQ